MFSATRVQFPHADEARPQRLPEHPQYPGQAISHILLGLGYFDDVDPDDTLPAPRQQIVDYWIRRQPEIA